MTKVELIKNLEFCESMIVKMMEYARDNYANEFEFNTNKTVIGNDIRHLRRELNEIRKKVEL